MHNHTADNDTLNVTIMRLYMITRKHKIFKITIVVSGTSGLSKVTFTLKRFHENTALTVDTGKQGLIYSTVVLTDLPRNGSTL